MDNSEEEKDGPIPPENEHDVGAKLTKSVDELNDLAIAIQSFKSRYDELQKHLEFIDQAIDKKTKELESLATSTAEEVTDDGDIVPLESESELKLKCKDEGAEDGEEEENELVSLCKTMCSRDLRRFILSHLSETTSLKKQVPVALKSAPNPSKLVFECIGRFFLQGSKAYAKDSPMIPARQASVLVLEYYLLSGSVETEERLEHSLKEETKSAATAWRKRLIFEGGVAKACETDARGLILFIGCFGVPDAFRNEDIGNLVRLSNPGEISDALRQSPNLRSKAPDVAEGIMKKGMVIEAVDLAYTFGFEENISSQSALTSFLQRSTEAWKKSKQEAPGVHSVMKKANEKYLTALKSVVNCLEGHKVDLVKLLPGWKLKETIQTLEKDISDLTKKLDDHSAAKRKLETSITSKKVRIPETKRTRFPVKDYSVASPSVTALREQRFASYLDGSSSYESSLMPHLLEGRSYGYTNNYPTAASVQIGSASSGGGNMLGGAITGSFYGYQGDRVMDTVGTTLNSNSYLYRRHGIGEEALSYDRSVGQSLVGQPSSARVNHLYGKISTDSIADLGDHLSVGVASRGGVSDLYGFADSVFDT